MLARTKFGLEPNQVSDYTINVVTTPIHATNIAKHDCGWAGS